MNRTVGFYTLGCKLNFSETSAIAQGFKEAGYEKVPFEERADIYVINTCSVTDNADKKCRKIVRDALRLNERAYIIVIGCYAQLKPQEIASIPGVSAVLGAAEKFRLLELLDGFEKQDEARVLASEIKEATHYFHAYSLTDRTRTFLKVQDGCNYNCSFCTIPLARGKSRSDTIDNIVKQAENIAQTDVKEVVLTGVNIGDFGIIDGKRQERFEDLLQELDKVNGIDRYRISSIEPNLLNAEIIRFVASSEKFVPHFHIPLQSGNDELLKNMRRRYRRDLYRDRVEMIKSLIPDCAIGVDVIVGFPGETEEHFMDTYQFLTDLDISYLHVFTYSERDNTPAPEMNGVVPKHERSKRSKMLRSLSEKKRRYFYNQYIGQQRPALFEAKEENGLLTGYTDNYIKVGVPYDEALINTVQQVELLEQDGKVMKGRLIDIHETVSL